MNYIMIPNAPTPSFCRQIVSRDLSVISGLAALVAVSILSISPALSHDGKVSIKITSGQRCFLANGLPNHETGIFPNRYNPNRIRSQNIRMCVTTTPTKNAKPKMHRGSIGISINGVQFRPGTAGYYDGANRHGHSHDPSSGWKLEGLNPGNILGMDNNNAHVGPNGLYHYHGVASSLVKSAGNGPMGYAADGFPIYYASSTRTSSYKLKSGMRPSGPGGAYDGTYEQDFVYMAGSGTLDQCNGMQINGKYAYFATETYPFLPRCLWGSVSADFNMPTHGAEEGRQRRNRQTGTSGNGRRLRGRRTAGNSTRQQRGTNRAGRRGPPIQAVEACEVKPQNAACTFIAPRRNRQLSGRCRQTRRGINACVPNNR